jgi:hypothetical protein
VIDQVVCGQANARANRTGLSEAVSHVGGSGWRGNKVVTRLA